MNKQVNCIGCSAEYDNHFLSCMTCLLAAQPGWCTEYRHKFNMSIEERLLNWSDLQ